MDLRKAYYDAVNGMDLDQDREKLQAYVRAVMNLQVPYKPII